MAVSLSEINSYRPEAFKAEGRTEVPIDISGAIQGYADYAKEKNRNTLLRYQMFQENLANFANTHKLDFAGVMKEDIPEIEKEGAKYFAKIKDNPQLLTVPNDPEWVSLQAKIAKSKQDNSYLEAQNEFRKMHPDLFDQTNNGIEQQYRTSSLERRKTFAWDLPASLDTQKLAEGTLKSIGEGFDEQTPATQPGYFLETKGTRYAKQKLDESGALVGGFDKAWADILESNAKIDNYGHTVRQSAEAEYNNLPEQLKAQFKKQNADDPVAAYWKQRGDAYYREKDITDTQLTEDKYTLEQQKLAQQKGIEDRKLGLAWWKAKNIDSPKAKAQVDLWKSNTIGSDEQKSAALGFGKRIYNELEDLMDKGNVISPDKVRQMTNEQLKYLGLDKGEEFDPITGKKKSGIQPLSLSVGEALFVKDGKVTVIKSAKKLSDGRWTGTFDQNRTTNIQNIVTNRVNEELKTAGSKELNAYLGADLLGGGDNEEDIVTVSETPTKTSESVKVKTVDLPATNGKIDPSKLEKGQSYNYNGKTYQWDGSKLIPQ